MTAPLPNDHWDPAVEEKRWFAALASARQTLDHLGEQLSKSSPDFHLLCLAELDAGSCLSRSEFSSRAAFVAELKRLAAEPTAPSQPVPSLQAYRDSQKWWLESLVKQYERNS
jgi:hypothetical protein